MNIQHLLDLSTILNVIAYHGQLGWDQVIVK